MLGETKGGTGLFLWTQAGVVGTNLLGNGAANIVYSPTIAIEDAEQLLFHIRSGNGAGGPIGTAIVARLQWSPDLAVLAWVEETIRNVGAIVAGAQQMTPLILEEGPTAAPWVMERPATAHYCRIGFYSAGAPGAGDIITVCFERQRGGQIQAGG